MLKTVLLSVCLFFRMICNSCLGDCILMRNMITSMGFMKDDVTERERERERERYDWRVSR